MSTVVPYLAVARQSFRRQATYRLAAMAGIFTNTVFGVIIAATLAAVYEARRAMGTPTVGGLDMPSALTLVFVAQGFLVAVAAFGWRELTDRVRAGEIASDLQRPVDVSIYWASVFVGQGTYALLARGVPPFVAGALLFHLNLPNDVATWCWFAASAIGATLVASRWWFLVSLCAFWIVGDVRGWLQLSTTLLLMGSGSLVPLQFFPETVQWVVRRTPFPAMLQLPGEVLLGRWSGAALLLVQLGWAVLLHLIGLAVFSRATKRLVIDGG